LYFTFSNKIDLIRLSAKYFRNTVVSGDKLLLSYIHAYRLYVTADSDIYGLGQLA